MSRAPALAGDVRDSPASRTRCSNRWSRRRFPTSQHNLHTSVNGVSWVLTAYLLSASIATPVIGRLGDMYGKERLLVVVLVLLCVATVVSALATTLAVMLVGRVVQGAAGGIFPLAFGIIRDEFPRERVASAVGGDVGSARRGWGRRRGARRADRPEPLDPLSVLVSAVGVGADNDCGTPVRSRSRRRAFPAG